MFKKLTSLSMAVTFAALAAGATFDTADAGYRRGAGVGVGVAAGIIGLGILGAAAANARPYGYGGSCYPGPRQCDYGGRRCWFNRYGEQVCGGGEYRCYRPTICN